jgi:lipoprotein NlpI
VNDRTWFDMLTQFQAGKVTEGELIAAVNPADMATRNAQLCEAYYFIGLEMLRGEKPEEARVFFEQAIETDIARLSAFRGAQMALRELGPETSRN